MRTLFSILFIVITSFSVFAQSPEKMSYQALVSNTANAPIISQAVGMRFSILQGSPTGTPIYVETHLPTTNANGLVSLEIGAGAVVSGTFSNINWGSGVFFLKVETDPNGGSNYSITGTSQLLSVPFALYAKTSGSSTSSGDPFYIGQDTLGGIVFYIEKDQSGVQHGLIVSITRGIGLRYQGPSTSTTNARSSWNGSANTALLPTTGFTASGAKIFATGLGAGWYVPSIDQLSLLFQNRYAVNRALNALSATEISNSNHWSSTERSSTSAYYFSFDDGHIKDTQKTTTYTVRAVKDF